MVMDAQPGTPFVWSPADDVLAYVSGEGIMLWQPDGATSTLLVSKEAPVSPPEPPLPPEAAGTGPGNLVWSPDGAWLAYEWSTWDTTDEAIRHGIWKVAANGGEPVQLYDSGIPERGQALLAGWTGDGQQILFWQGPILSASILADGVPLYALPAEGGEAQLLAEPVLFHSDFVAPHPGDQTTVALVVGGYRATWTEKQLQVITLEIEGTEVVQPPSSGEQAVSSPAWDPNGEKIAFVAMPDEGDLGGGPEAQAGLTERRLWLWEPGQEAFRQLTDEPGYRDEYPQWLDAQHLLFARLDQEGRASLWIVDSAGGMTQQVVDELTPAPEWFGYYGYIAWDELFAVWTPPAQPSTLASSLPTAVPTPTATPAGRSLAAMLPDLHSGLTAAVATQLWGEPDEVTGSGLLIYKYRFADGLVLWLSFPGADPILGARLEGAGGAAIDLALPPAPSETQELTPTVSPPAGTSTPSVAPADAPAGSPTATATPIPADTAPTATATPAPAATAQPED